MQSNGLVGISHFSLMVTNKRLAFFVSPAQEVNPILNKAANILQDEVD